MNRKMTESKKMTGLKKIKQTVVCVAALASMSCSLLPKKGEVVKINSNPSAEVILGDGSHDLGNSIGRTPLEVNFSEVAKGELVYLKLVSDKYEDYQLILPSTWKQGEVNIKLNRKENILPSDVEDKMVEKMKNLNTSQILGVLQVQKQLQQGDFGKASSEIVNLKRLRAPSAIVNLLDGNLSYLKGNKRKALGFYKRSFIQYNKNYEVKALIERLEKEVGN
jgi:hypothetical protein